MFYQKNSVEVLNDLDSNLTGLTQEESKLRLEKYGCNALQEKSKTPTWRLFLENFKDNVCQLKRWRIKRCKSKRCDVKRWVRKRCELKRWMAKR